MAEIIDLTKNGRVQELFGGDGRRGPRRQRQSAEGGGRIEEMLSIAEASKRWRWYREDEDFDEVFIGLFRGRDQQVAKLWLDLVRAKAGQHPACLKAGETTLSIRLNKTQVERAENILLKLGLSMSEAVSLFLAQVLLWDGLPFGVALPDPDDREDMAPTEGQLSLDNEPEIPWDEDVSAEA